MTIKIKTYTSDSGDREVHFYDAETNEWLWGYNTTYIMQHEVDAIMNNFNFDPDAIQNR